MDDPMALARRVWLTTKSVSVVRSGVELKFDQGRHFPRTSSRFQSYIWSADATDRVCT